MPMLEVLNLTRRFGSQIAVDDVSFQVPDGHLTGFVGGNGAGKTTTMRMMATLARGARPLPQAAGHRPADLPR